MGGGVRQAQGALWIPSCAVNNFCTRVTRGTCPSWRERTPSTRTLVDLASRAADFLVSDKAAKRARPTQAQRLARSVLRLACALSLRVFGPPILAPWQLHALRDPQKQHLAGAEDYVDAVYMALAAAHAQASAAGSGRRRLRTSLGNSTHSVVRPPRGR